MATRYYGPSATGDWTATASWAASFGGATGSTAPTTGDTGFVSNTEIPLTTNVTGLTATVLAALHILGGPNNMRAAVGASGAELDVGANAVNIFGIIAPVYYAGPVTNAGAGLLSIRDTLPGRRNGVILSQSGAATVDNLEVAGNSSVEVAASWAMTASTGRRVRLGGNCQCYFGAVTWPTSTNYTEISLFDNAFAEFQSLPTNTASGSASRLVINGGRSIIRGSSACPQIVINNGECDYRATVAPAGVTGGAGGADDAGFRLLGKGAKLTLDNSPVDLSLTIEHTGGTFISANAPGKAFTFTEYKRGEGASVFAPMARSISGLSGFGGTSGTGA